MFSKVWSVDDVHLTILKTNPLALRIVSTGQVTSSGWTDPQLSAFIYVMPPADGIYDFDFIARKPEGPSLDVMLPISVVFHWQPFPSGLKGVRVHASQGSMEKMLGGSAEVNLQAPGR